MTWVITASTNSLAPVRYQDKADSFQLDNSMEFKTDYKNILWKKIHLKVIPGTNDFNQYRSRQVVILQPTLAMLADQFVVWILLYFDQTSLKFIHQFTHSPVHQGPINNGPALWDVSRSFMTMTLTFVWPWWGRWMHRIVTGWLQTSACRRHLVLCCCLVPDRWQAIIWTNDDLVHWGICICATRNRWVKLTNAMNLWAIMSWDELWILHWTCDPKWFYGDMFIT